MSKNKSAVPDAWEDDWEAQADKLATAPEEPEPEAKLSKAERKAKHAEANKQIWEAAESPERPLFLEARDNVPLKGEFKPTMKVLSRKPPPKVASRSDATSSMANLNLDDDEDSEEEERKKAQQEFAERQARAQREREEKQRKYQEVRERLFGAAGSAAEENQSRSSSVNDGGSRNSSRGKGRGRADREGRGTPSADQSPARPASQRKQLYDPSYTTKPNSVFAQRKDAAEASGTGPSTPNEEKPIRAPKGPDGSGRGGFGFASRGNRIGANS